MPLVRKNRRSAWVLVGDYVKDYQEENPNGTLEDCRKTVEKRLRSDFGEMPEWVTKLLEVLMLILPLFFQSKK